MITEQKTKKLRSGFSTGACAAAAAKAAMLYLLGMKDLAAVAIPFPGGVRHEFALCRSGAGDQVAMATVVKDAGDDPDVTNGAEIGARVRFLDHEEGTGEFVTFRSGEGVGMVTKPGLSVKVGEPAINPVPRSMIREAVAEAFVETGQEAMAVEVEVFVRDGEVLAEKTLNRRLGIIGGLSILGTTGIVRPVSARAWTDTIEASMDVARAAGLEDVLLSTGRTSEAAVQAKVDLPEEAQVMMGDYLAYALEASRKHGFSRIYIAAMWAKLLKCALAVPQTHVRHGALEPCQVSAFLETLGLQKDIATELAGANTAREIYDRLVAMQRHDLIEMVCARAKIQAEKWAGLPVSVYLVTSEEGVVCHVPY